MVVSGLGRRGLGFRVLSNTSSDSPHRLVRVDLDRCGGGSQNYAYHFGGTYT